MWDKNSRSTEHDVLCNENFRIAVFWAMGAKTVAGPISTYRLIVLLLERANSSRRVSALSVTTKSVQTLVLGTWLRRGTK